MLVKNRLSVLIFSFFLALCLKVQVWAIPPLFQSEINALIELDGATQIKIYDADVNGADDIFYIDSNGALKIWFSDTKLILTILSTESILDYYVADIEADHDLDVVILSNEVDNSGSLNKFELKLDGSAPILTTLVSSGDHVVKSFYVVHSENPPLILFIDNQGDLHSYDHLRQVRTLVENENVVIAKGGEISGDSNLDIVFINGQGDIKTFSEVEALVAPLVSANHTSNPSNNPKPIWSWSSRNATFGTGVFRYRINGAEYSDMTFSKSFQAPQLLNDGSYTFSVQELSKYGYWSEPGTLTFELDTSNLASEVLAPSVSSDLAVTLNRKPRWSWTSNNGDLGERVYEVSLNGSFVTMTTNHFYLPKTNLSYGNQTLSVREKIVDGSYSPSGEFTVKVFDINSDAFGITSSILKKIKLIENARSFQLVDNQSALEIFYIDIQDNIKKIANGSIKTIYSVNPVDKLIVTDYDGDGAKDCVFTTKNDLFLVLLQNQNTILSPQLTFGQTIRDFLIEDFDQANLSDIIYVNGDGDVYVHKR